MTIKAFIDKHKSKTNLNEAQVKALLDFKISHSKSVYENFLCDLYLSKFISYKEYKDLICIKSE